ncbi:hypothetical protein ABPG75_002714 [Micractinium tetrahymenae]
MTESWGRPLCRGELATAGGNPAAGAAAATCSDATALEEAWAQAAGLSSPAAAHGSAGGDEASTSQPKALSFDPLARETRRVQRGGGSTVAPAAAAGAPTGKAGSPQLEGEDMLSQGFSKLLAELAQAEEEATLGAEGEPGQPTAGQQQEQQQQQHDLNATLRALSEQAPSFAGRGEGESEEEMLRLLAEHLGALGAGREGGTGGGGAPPEMSSLVDTIMHQLLSKEVLYQPMKDIGAKYPEWLEANKSKLSQEEYEQYRQQHGFIQRICAVYESSPSDFAQLIDLLQQMQQCGQPPQEIVDELAPGMQFGPDGLPSFGGSDEGLPPELRDCAIM